MKRMRVLYRHYVITKASGSTYCMVVVDTFNPQKYTTLADLVKDIAVGHPARYCTSAGANVTNTIMGFISSKTASAFTATYISNNAGTFSNPTFTAASVYADNVIEVSE